MFLRGEHLELMYEKLCIRAGGDKENIPPIWEPIPLPEGILAEGEDASEQEVAVPKIHSPRPCN